MVSACRIPPFLSFKPFQAGINLAHDKKHVIERIWPEAGGSAALAVILIGSSPALIVTCRSPSPIPLPLSRSFLLHLNHATAGEINNRTPFPRRIARYP